MLSRDRRSLLCAVVLGVLTTSCGPAVTVRRLAPAPYNLGPVRTLVLTSADGPSPRETELVRSKFLERIDLQGVFKIDDAVPPTPDVFDFFERLFSKESTSRAKEAQEYRKRHPGDVYVRLRVTEIKTFRRDERKEKGSEERIHWAEGRCTFQVTLVDGRDGSRIARYTADHSSKTPIYDEWRQDLLDIAEKDAVRGAVDDALGQFTPQRVTERLELDEKAPRAAEGIELIKGDKLKEARLLWEKAAKENPQSGGVAYNLGCVSEALGDSKAAREWYQEAIRLDPASERNRKAADALAKRLADAERLRRRD